jgi:hypothetical protein
MTRLEQHIERIAKACHEANRLYCLGLGDTSQPKWEDAPQWQRDSAINGVKFHLINPDAGDDASHNAWMAEKVAAGWVHGDIKDPDANPPTHPCIVPFHELPAKQQHKDTLFRTIVHAHPLPPAAPPAMRNVELEARIAEQSGQRVTAQMMTARIADISYRQIDLTVTICSIRLDNGYSVRGESACVDPANFDAEIDQKIAYDNAFNQLWHLFGFLLAEQRFIAHARAQ